jgi:hypothetical protein
VGGNTLFIEPGSPWENGYLKASMPACGNHAYLLERVEDLAIEQLRATPLAYLGGRARYELTSRPDHSSQAVQLWQVDLATAACFRSWATTTNRSSP